MKLLIFVSKQEPNVLVVGQVDGKRPYTKKIGKLLTPHPLTTYLM